MIVTGLFCKEIWCIPGETVREGEEDFSVGEKALGPEANWTIVNVYSCLRVLTILAVMSHDVLQAINTDSACHQSSILAAISPTVRKTMYYSIEYILCSLCLVLCVDAGKPYQIHLSWSGFR